MHATLNQISLADNLARKAGFEGGYRVPAYYAYNELVGDSEGRGRSIELTFAEVNTLINYFNAYPEAKKEINETLEKAQFDRKMGKLEIVYVDPEDIIPPHDVVDKEKYMAMRKTLQTGGKLPPIILDHRGEGNALSGSHRLAAWNDEGYNAAVIYTKPKHEKRMDKCGDSFEEIIDSLPNKYRKFDQ